MRHHSTNVNGLRRDKRGAKRIRKPAFKVAHLAAGVIPVAHALATYEVPPHPSRECGCITASSDVSRSAFANPLSRWHTLPPEAARLKTPPAALPGANLLKRLPNIYLVKVAQHTLKERRM